MPSTKYPEVRNYVKACEKPLGELMLAHEREFIIPLNQRPWSWREVSNVQPFLDDFWNTVCSFFDRNSAPKWKQKKSPERPQHFFGTFVFFSKSDKHFEVFDGQQRLTAVVMLCSALREIAYEQASISGEHQTKANDVYGGFSEWLKISPTSSTPRLKPNALFQPVFDALMFGPVTEEHRIEALQALPDETKSHDISRKLKSSFYYIRNWLHEQLDAETPKDKTAFLLAAYDALRHLFSCIEAKILDEEYAYEVFQSLNTKGERLTTADNIKNEIFKESDKEDHQDISDKWNAAGENVPEQDIGEFLRRRHIALIAPCKKTDAYKQIRDAEIRGADAKKVAEGWYQDSQRLRRILQREASWARSDTLGRLEVIFSILGVSLAYIPILSGAKVLLPGQKDDFHRCVTITESYVFRALTIGGMDTVELERKLGEAARIFTGGGTVDDYHAYLKAQSDDVSFASNFATHIDRRTKVQYYILSELEKYLLGNGKGVVPGSHHFAKNHVEHILPKTPSKAKDRIHEWAWARKNPELHHSLVNRLGNLMVLESDINKSVASHDYHVKQSGESKKNKSGKIKKIKCYSDSALAWPSRLCDVSTWPNWEPEDIERRQKEMAQDALKVWTL